ncbi:AMP-dependent synthetase/ligase [Streptomyces sp. NPDC051776]|uniref:AMP-dependent synthetase/ligase n=1 Tax=Streptomyces sp. NPDC051776 TaxID=3155414 RepID=UPI0034476063
MRELGLPPLVESLKVGGLADALFENAERAPDLTQFSRRADPASTEWSPVTAADFRQEVTAVAKGLMADGIGFGDRVALMSRTRYEWTLFSFAVWTIGAQLVPVYPTSSSEQVHWILYDSKATAIIVEHEDHVMTVGAVCDGLPLRRIWQLDAGCVAELTECGRGVADALLHQRRSMVQPELAATITYTSGTTGRPKGCVITHANLAIDCDTLLTGWGSLLADPGVQPSVLAVLPLSHIYGLMMQVACVRGGVRLGHQPEVATRTLVPALRSFQPTFIYAVPYVFEKIYQRGRRTAEELGRVELFDKAVEVAVRYAEALERRALGTGTGPSPSLRVQHALYDRTVYERMRAALGGRAKYAMCAGSALDRNLALLFAGVGITIYDGYGLTETSGGVTAQPLGRVRFGTVGRPLPGCAVRIAWDGEILVRGAQVFAGYLDDRPGTEAVLRDGWLHTGDVGTLDDDGYLSITGRKKDIIITSGGKSVAPAVLEERMRANPLVSQCLVVGDNRPFISALITLDPEAIDHWRRLHRKQHLEARALVADEELREEVRRAVLAANSAVSRAESIRAFEILPAEFSAADGLMTPSLKLRRAAIVKAYVGEINRMYAARPSG